MNNFNFFKNKEKYTSDYSNFKSKNSLILLFSLFYLTKFSLIFIFSIAFGQEYNNLYFFTLYIFISTFVLIFLLVLKFSKSTFNITLKEKLENITFTDLDCIIIFYIIFGLFSFVVITPLYLILHFVPKNKIFKPKYAIPIAIIIIFIELLFYFIFNIFGVIFPTLVILKIYKLKKLK